MPCRPGPGAEPTAKPLSTKELRLLASGYNWWGKHEEAYEAAVAILRTNPPLDDVRDLAAHIQNRFIDDIPALLSTFDSFIESGWGPAAYWHLRKADWYRFMATGELELDCSWESGCKIVHPGYLRDAAAEVEKAREVDPHVMDTYEYEYGNHWNDRFAALFTDPSFQHLRHTGRPETSD